AGGGDAKVARGEVRGAAASEQEPERGGDHPAPAARVARGAWARRRADGNGDGPSEHVGLLSRGDPVLRPSFGNPAVRSALTRGFASPPRDGFALFGKSLRRLFRNLGATAMPRVEKTPLTCARSHCESVC